MLFRSTEEAEVTSMNDSGGIGIPGEIVESREATANVCDAQEATMGSVKHLCLSVDLILRRTRVGRGGGTRRSGCGP